MSREKGRFEILAHDHTLQLIQLSKPIIESTVHNDYEAWLHCAHYSLSPARHSPTKSKTIPVGCRPKLPVFSNAAKIIENISNQQFVGYL